MHTDFDVRTSTQPASKLHIQPIAGIIKKGITTLSLTVCFSASGQWTDFNPGITGDFYDITTVGSTSYICGSTGIYSSTDMIAWTPISISSPSDAIIYEQTIFYGLYTYDTPVLTYACGEDTVNHTGVIFKCSGGVWALDHTAATPSSFNDISIFGSGSSARVYVVGDHGSILMRIGNAGAWTSYNYPTTTDLYSVYVAATNKVMVGGDDLVLYSASTTPSWDSINEYTFTDLAYWSPTNAFYGVQTDQINRYSTGGTGSWTVNTGIYPSADAQSIHIPALNSGFVGGVDGIYKCTSVGAGYPWELQPSSSGYDVREIKGTTTTAYAVGKNGTMLKTTNGGGTVFYPYVNFLSPTGACKDTVVFFDNLSKPGSTCSWFIDGVLQATSFDLNYAFTTIGTHEVKLVVNNGSYIVSEIKNIQVVSLPDATLSFDVSDTLHCKTGESFFTIHNTENDVHYSLYFIESDNTTNELIGNGGDLELSTGTLSDSVHVLVRARRYNSDCWLYFPDTTQIGVEKTKANFHASYINADSNYPVHFYNKSKQASYFNWEIQTPTPFLSTNFEFAHVYSDTGQYPIQLIAESANGCIDTLVKNGPYVYTPDELQSYCWAIQINPLVSGGYTHNRIHDIEVDSVGNNYIVGSFNNSDFNTKTGLDYTPPYFGSYLAKYDTYGVLKWIVQIDQTQTPTYENYLTNYSRYGDAFNVDISEEGNIYVCGWFEQKGRFIDNAGDTIKTTNTGEGYVLKLDSLGKYIWSVRVTQPVHNLEVGADEKLFITGKPYNSGIAISFVGTDALVTTIPAPTNGVYLARLNAAGHFDFATRTIAVNSSDAFLNYGYDIALDSLMNVTFVYAYEYASSPPPVYSASEPTFNATLPYHSGCMFAQYDSSGNFNWLSTLYSPGANNHHASAIDLDDEGNIYAFMKFGANTSAIYKDPAGTLTNIYNLEMVLLALNNSGEFLWNAGTSNHSYHNGMGDLVVQDSLIYVLSSIYNGGTDSLWLISASGLDSIGFTAAAMSGNITNFSTWSTDGDLLAQSFHNGPDDVSAPFDSDYKSLAADKDGNMIFGSYGNIFSEDFIMAGEEISYVTGQAAILCKYNQGMCFNSFDLDDSSTICLTNTVDIPLNFQAIDTAQNDTTSYFVILADATTGAIIDTVYTMSSTENLDTLSFAITGLNTGDYSLFVESANPDYSSEGVTVSLISPPLAQVLDTTICLGESISYSASDADFYTWSPATGVNDPFGQHILITPPASGLYVGTLTNYCGSVFDSIQITLIEASVLAGDDAVICEGDSVFLNATGTSPILWSGGIPNGTYIHPLSSMTMIAQASLSGCSAEDTIQITVNLSPVPTVFIFDDTLLSTQVYDSYQWYLDGVLIPGATNQTYEYTTNGNYTVSVSENGCTALSTAYTIFDVGITETGLKTLKASPNPTSSTVWIYDQGRIPIKLMQCTDMAGNKLNLATTAVHNGVLLDLSTLAQGVYFVQVEYNGRIETLRVIKN